MDADFFRQKNRGRPPAVLLQNEWFKATSGRPAPVKEESGETLAAKCRASQKHDHKLSDPAPPSTEILPLQSRPKGSSLTPSLKRKFKGRAALLRRPNFSRIVPNTFSAIRLRN